MRGLRVLRWLGACGVLAVALSVVAPASAQVVVGPAYRQQFRGYGRGGFPGYGGYGYGFNNYYGGVVVGPGYNPYFGNPYYGNPYYGFYGPQVVVPGYVGVAPGTINPGFIPQYPGDAFGNNLATPAAGGTSIPGYGVVNGPFGGATAPGNGQYSPGVSGNRLGGAGNGQYSPGVSGNRAR
jgi:hypothetical protein